jgi:hypothetical protein
MAIKNTKLGGTDFNTPTERIRPSDLNDTFDASAGWLDAIGMIFKNQAQTIFNNEYSGWSSRLGGDGEPQLKNLDYDVFTSNSMAIIGDIEYDATNDWYWGPTDMDEGESDTFDEFNDESVDTELWTESIGSYSSSITETSGGELIVRHDGEDAHNSTSLTSKDMWRDYDAVMVYVNSMTTGGGSNTYPYAKVTYNGDTIVGISGPSKSLSDYKIQIVNIKGQTSYYRDHDGTSWSQWTNSDGVGEISFVAGQGGDSSANDPISTTKIDYIRYNTLATFKASSTNHITSDTVATTSTITNAIGIVNGITDSQNGDSDIIINLTADGTNYEEATDTEIHGFTNTGTSLKTRLILQGAGAISEYAVAYNWY